MRAPLLLLALLATAHATSTPSPRAVSHEFPLDGISKIVLRAAHAESAVVTRTEAKVARVRGVAFGTTSGYHPPDPNWKETPPEKWGLDFVAQRHGSTLVISTRKEIEFIHHHYTLMDISLEVPAEIEVVRVQRKLSGDWTPDLSEP